MEKVKLSVSLIKLTLILSLIKVPFKLSICGGDSMPDMTSHGKLLQILDML